MPSTEKRALQRKLGTLMRYKNAARKRIKELNKKIKVVKRELYVDGEEVPILHKSKEKK